MIELKDFLEEYEKRFSKIVSTNIDVLKSSSQLHHNLLFKKFLELGCIINYDNSLLLPEIIFELNIDTSLKIKDGLYEIPISSFLLKSSYSIQAKELEKFNITAIQLLEESQNRDFPKSNEVFLK